MEVEYDLTLSDVEAFARFHRRYRPKLKPHFLERFVGHLLGVLTVGLLGLAVWFSFQPHGHGMAGFCAGSVVGLVGGLVVLALLQWKLILVNTTRLYDREACRWFFAWRQFRITADGFELTSEFEHLRLSWSAVSGVFPTDEHIFFYTTPHQAHIVPRRAFRDPQHFEDFFALARHYRANRGIPDRPASSPGRPASPPHRRTPPPSPARTFRNRDSHARSPRRLHRLARRRSGPL